MAWRGRLPLAAGLVALSGVLTALQLSTSLFVLHLYDHVLPSRSPAALAGLVGLMLALHAGFALLDLVRARALCRAGLAFVQDLDRRVLDALEAGAARPGFEALGDVDRVGRFLTNPGPAAFLDVVWLPACLAALCLMHPVLALFGAAGVVLLGGLAVTAEARSRKTAKRIAGAERRRLALVPAVRAGSARRWHALSKSTYRLKGKAAEQALAVGALGKGLRLMLMSGGLGLGALLVISEAMSAGALVASSVILGRIFASLDCALAHWRSFVAARESYRRLVAIFPAERAAPDLSDLLRFRRVLRWVPALRFPRHKAEGRLAGMTNWRGRPRALRS